MSFDESLSQLIFYRMRCCKITLSLSVWAKHRRWTVDQLAGCWVAESGEFMIVFPLRIAEIPGDWAGRGNGSPGRPQPNRKG